MPASRTNPKSREMVSPTYNQSIFEEEDEEESLLEEGVSSFRPCSKRS